MIALCRAVSSIVVNTKMEDYELNGPTLEEGRIALNELEKYLKDKNVTEFPALGNGHGRQGHNVRSAHNGRQHNEERKLHEDRKLMDHVPRSERLKHVKGSPLGLTLDVSFSPSLAIFSVPRTGMKFLCVTV